MYAGLRSLALALLKCPAELPHPPAGDHASVRVFRASPRFLTYGLVKLALGMALAWIGLAVGFVAALVEGEAVAAILVACAFGALLAVTFLSYFVLCIDYELRTYVVTDRSIRVREGAWTIREMTLTHANVQNLRVEQGPIMRWLGIAHLVIDTAGGGAARGKHAGESGHKVKLEGIENAAEVRDLVLEHLRRRGGGAGLGDLDDGPGRKGEGVPRGVVAALRDVRDAAAGLRGAAEAWRG